MAGGGKKDGTEPAEEEEKKGLLSGSVNDREVDRSSSSNGGGAAATANGVRHKSSTKKRSRFCDCALRPFGMVAAAGLIVVGLLIYRSFRTTGAPPLCVSYDLSHELVKKQLHHGLTRHEVVALMEASPYESSHDCVPAPGTVKLAPDMANLCIAIGEPYTVCYKTTDEDETLEVMEGDWKPGTLHCGIFYGGVKTMREGRETECLGGCNEVGSQACSVNVWTKSCFMHDVCSVVNNADLFKTDPVCGPVVHEYGDCVPIVKPKFTGMSKLRHSFSKESPPCLNYSMDHPLVKKQMAGEELSIQEVRSLVQVPVGENFDSCLPVRGTMKLYYGTRYDCVKQRQPYTVCFDTRRHRLDGVLGTSRRRGTYFCGLFLGGVHAMRADGNLDCLGGCNEGKRACGVHEWRGGCFMHDACSIMNNAKGFLNDPNCGDEALDATEGFGKCGPVEWEGDEKEKEIEATIENIR